MEKCSCIQSKGRYKHRDRTFSSEALCTYNQFVVQRLVLPVQVECFCTRNKDPWAPQLT